MSKLLSFVLVVLLALGGLAFVLPARVSVERSIIVNRPAATVFTVLDSFTAWTTWSPFTARDPSVMVTRSGPARGPGAQLAWSGDPGKAGLGTQEILESDPAGRIRLRMSQGYQAESLLTYEIAGDALGSRVTWAFESDVTSGEDFPGQLIGRYYGWFLARWVATDFERGLERFKAYAETLPRADFSRAEISRVLAEPMVVARVPGLSAASPEALADVVAQSFAAISAWALRHGVDFEGQPFTITRRLKTGQEVHEAAVPVSPESQAPEEGDVSLGTTPSGDAVCVLHRGSPLDTLGSYEQLSAWVMAQGFSPSGVSWEHYLSDPTTTSPSAAIMEICMLLEPREEKGS